MDISNMTRRQFEKLPYRESFDIDVVCDGLVILPATINPVKVLVFKMQVGLSKLAPKLFRRPEIYELDGMHDSGYRVMDFVACKDGQAICRLSGHSDVLHIEGIGGYGKDWFKKYGTIPTLVPLAGWSIDCLPRSGLLRLFTIGKRQLRAGMALSSFEIFSEEVV